MAITIDTTVGGSSSNSYINLSDADDYFTTRLHASTWTNATNEVKKAALVWATRILDDKFIWKGQRINDDQSLGWPRYDVVYPDGLLIGYDYGLEEYSIPKELKNSVCELALSLIGSDPLQKQDNKGLKSIKVDVIALEFDKDDKVGEVLDSVSNTLILLYRAPKVSSDKFRTVELIRV